MTPAGLDLRVYRLSTAARPAQLVCCERAARAGHWHDVGDRVLYAYETEQLAALSLSQRLRGPEPGRLVHETLELPDDPHLHAEFRVAGDGNARRAFFAPGAAQLPYVNLCAQLRQRNLLSLWVTSPYAAHQRTVLLNPDHAAFARVRIQSQLLADESALVSMSGRALPARMAERRETATEAGPALGDSGLVELGTWAEAGGRHDRSTNGSGLRAALRSKWR